MNSRKLKCVGLGSRRLYLLLAAAALLGCARGASECLIYQTSTYGWGSNVFGALLRLLVVETVACI